MAPTLASKCRVLIVEDDASTARTLASLLREDGYEVEVSHDGAAAIVRLGKAPSIDILIVDYKLPSVDGLAVATYGRGLLAPPHVVMVTSYPEVVARLDHGLDPSVVLLAKPLVYDELMQVLDRIRASTPPTVASG